MKRFFPKLSALNELLFSVRISMRQFCDNEQIFTEYTQIQQTKLKENLQNIQAAFKATSSRKKNVFLHTLGSSSNSKL